MSTLPVIIKISASSQISVSTAKLVQQTLFSNDFLVIPVNYYHVSEVLRVWNMRTFASKNYKIVQVNNKMTTREFIAKVAKIFNVRKELICVTYDFDTRDEVVKVEIEESNDNSLHHAVEVLKNYSKLTVEVKLQPSPAELSIADGKRALRSKEVEAEQLKREMGLHDDAGKRTRGFLGTVQ